MLALPSATRRASAEALDEEVALAEASVNWVAVTVATEIAAVLADATATLMAAAVAADAPVADALGVDTP